MASASEARTYVAAQSDDELLVMLSLGLAEAERRGILDLVDDGGVA